MLVPAGVEGWMQVVRHDPVFPENWNIAQDPTAVCQLLWLVKVVIVAAMEDPAMIMQTKPSRVALLICVYIPLIKETKS